MSRRKPSIEDENELDKIIAHYEEVLTYGESYYLDADVLADIADRYAEQQRWDDAQQAITYGLQLHPDSTDLLIEQSLLYLDTQQLAKAIEVADSITDTTDEIILLRGELMLNAKREQEAEELFRSFDEVDYDYRVDVASLYTDTGYPSYALKWLNEALERYPESEEILLMKADCHTLLQESESAAAIYNQLLDKEPYNIHFWLGLARTHFAAQEYPEALNATDFALVADEKCGEAYLIRGHVLFNLNRGKEALTCYVRAIELNAISPAIGYIFLGMGCNNIQQWEDACHAFDKALTHAKDNFAILLPDINLGYAIASAHLGKFEKAYELCQAAKNDLPEDSEPLLVEGHLQQMQGDIDTAWETWNLAIDYSDDQVETFVRISDYCLLYSQWEEARNCFENILLRDHNYDRIYVKLAILSLLMGDETSFRAYSLYVDPPLEVDEILALADRYEERDDANKSFWDLIDKLKEEQE